MLQSKTKWKYMEENKNIIDKQGDSLELSPIVEKLLVQRGITTQEEARTFLSPDLKNLHHSSNLDSIDRACERVHQAIRNQEKIVIYGDYDADGVSSTAVMLKALRELGAICDYYIPNRFTEGYGPNEQAFRQLHDNGYTLIITVDNGIAAVNEAEAAQKLGVDLIITDHHEPQGQLPDAYAIIHPKCSPDYSFPELAGVGVAFKFAEQLLGYFPKQLLDLVAIGTIADLVPLVDENRILAYFGLHALSITKNPGLKALKEVCKIEGNVTDEDVGFSIGPRMNAVGRLQDADLAVDLLMTDDQREALEIAEEMEHINQRRRELVSEIAEEAASLLDSQGKQDFIVVAKEGWNEGVLGIVASRLVQKFDRPAIVLNVKSETGEVKGSARSIPAFDLFKNCMRIRDLFTHFGGHAQAAGMTFPMENIEAVKEALNTFIHETLNEADYTQETEISAVISADEVDESLINEIARLAPFGTDNPKPLFQIDEIPQNVRQIGVDKKHLKMQFEQNKGSFEAIGFGFGDLYHSISPYTHISVIGELGVNEWNGRRKAQIIIRDMRIDEWQLFDARGKRWNDIRLSVSSGKRNLAVTSTSEKIHPHMEQITYETGTNTLESIDELFIFDLPEKLTQLEDIIKQTNPKNIHACYRLEDSAYLKVFPKRDEFVWLYALIRKRQVLDLKNEMTKIMQMKQWSKNRILFMSHVFFDLGFVKIENGVITIHSNPKKKDLSDSATYQRHLEQAEIEKTLYYSNYEDLRDWFGFYLEKTKEEVVNGL